MRDWDKLIRDAVVARPERSGDTGSDFRRALDFAIQELSRLLQEHGRTLHHQITGGLSGTLIFRHGTTDEVSIEFRSDGNGLFVRVYRDGEGVAGEARCGPVEAYDGATLRTLFSLLYNRAQLRRRITPTIHPDEL
jgi:hypothetical protein